jgi:hypothetical protein
MRQYGERLNVRNECNGQKDEQCGFYNVEEFSIAIDK